MQRALLPILKDQCFQGKVIIVLGARQVGKTTLLRQLMQELKQEYVWLNADEADVYRALDQAETSTALLQLIGEKKLLVIDEAQQIPNIGKKLKLIYDTRPEIQVIATGSSAFELQNQMNEPLTGRKREYLLFPPSYIELSQYQSPIEEQRLLSTRLVYGSYPEVVNNPGKEQEALLEIASSYLYKDILQIEGLRKASHIEKLLQALAFQIGQEVSFLELAQTVGNTSSATIERYISFLEQAYIIYKLPALSRNYRNELKKAKKYYFYDNGIRNMLIGSFQPSSLRADIGALWENYLLSERLKTLSYERVFNHRYFWRTADQAEIDYLEEREGTLHAYEIKWKKKQASFPKSFITSYPNHTTHVVHQENYVAFLQGLGSQNTV